MNLRDYLRELKGDARDGFAARCGTTRGHLQNVMYGYKPCSPELAVAIEQASDGAVRRPELCPDNWHRVWPELIGADGAPQPTAEGA